MVDASILAALRTAKTVFNENKTLTLISHVGDRVWAGKVYFAEADGYIYVALEKGRNYRNIKENPHVFFVIEHGVPDRFIQGEGVAEELGPIEERPERHILFRKVFELVPFAKAFPGVTVFRIRPTRLFISDFTGVWKPRTEIEVTDEVLRIFRERYPTRTPRWKKYLQAVRPFSFTATAIPVLLGALLAPRVHGGLLFLTLLGALALHAGVNVISDYFDYRRGADTWRVLGSSRVLVDQIMAPRPLFRWGILLFVLGCSIGLYLVYLRGLPILWIGMIGAALGMFYTAPPLGLKYRALGDVAVFIAFGPLMALGAFYVQTQTLDPRVAYLAVPIGLLTIAILHGNNYRDIQEDLQAGYRTVAVLLGPRGSGIYYLCLVAFAYGLTVWFVMRGWFPVGCLLVVLTLPVAWRNVRIAFQPARVAFTFLDLLTAQLHLYFGLALVIGLVLAQWHIAG